MDDADGVGGIMQANAEAPKYHGSAKTWPRVYVRVGNVSALIGPIHHLVFSSLHAQKVQTRADWKKLRE